MVLFAHLSYLHPFYLWCAGMPVFLPKKKFLPFVGDFLPLLVQFFHFKSYFQPVVGLYNPNFSTSFFSFLLTKCYCIPVWGVVRVVLGLRVHTPHPFSYATMLCYWISLKKKKKKRKRKKCACYLSLSK